MKLKDGFVLNKVGGSYLAVAVGERADEFHALIRMNETGAFLWNLIDGVELSEEELVAKLLSEYEVSRDLASADVKKFVSQLREAKLLND